MLFRVNGAVSSDPFIYVTTGRNMLVGDVAAAGYNPTQKLHVAGNLRVTGAYYDSTNSPGTNGQVLKNVGGLPVWSNP